MLPVIDRLLVDRTDASSTMGDNQSVLDQVLKSLEEAHGRPPAQLASLHLRTAQLYSRLGHYADAATHAQKAANLDGASPTASEALLELGICAIESNDLDAAEERLHQAADHCRRTGHKSGLARALHNLSVGVFTIRGKFNLALSSMEEAQALYAEQGVQHWGLPWLRSYVFLLRGELRRARQALDELVRQIEPGTRLAGGYYYLWARLEIDEGQYDKAREYLRLCLRIATQTGVPELNVWARIELSRLYRLSGQAQAALEWVEEGLKHARRSNLLYSSALSLVQLAKTQWTLDDTPQALTSLNQALAIFEQLQADHDLAYALYWKAVWTAQLDDPQAGPAWQAAVSAITRGGYAFLLEREQETAFPLLAAHLRSPQFPVRQAAESVLPNLSKVSPPPLRILTLGQFTVWKGSRLIPDRAWQRRKAGDLFRYLLLQPGRSAGKDAILDALWPEANFESGAGQLHQATSTLRHILEPDLPDKFPSRYLAYEGEQILLTLPPRSVVDFEQFDQSLHATLNSSRLDDLQNALRLYTGDLLPADLYADWTAEMRTRLIELYEQGLLKLAQQHLVSQQYADGLDCCRQILRRDPWSEDATLIAMQIYIQLDAAPHALRKYRMLEQTLRDELNIRPRADLRALAESIQNR